MGSEQSQGKGRLEIRRRELLKAAGVGALAAAGAPLVKTARADGRGSAGAHGNDYDAIVVGAGFAGATAARDLGKSGMKVLVLEGRNRLGGRTFTSEFAGKRIEFGGTYIHWLQPHIWAEQTRYDLELKEVNTSDFDRFIKRNADGKLEEHDPDKAWKELNAGFDKFNHDSWDYFPRPFDPLFVDAVKKLDQQSVAQRLDSVGLTGLQKDLVSSIFGILSAGDFNEAAASALLRQYAAGGWNTESWLDALAHYKFKDGTISMITALLEDSGAEVRVGTPVAAIQRDGKQVVVTTADGDEISARAAVVTVPVNTYHNIDFKPGLSGGKAQLARKTQMGRCHKVWVHVRENVGFIACAAPSRDPFCWMTTEYADKSGTVLSAFGNDASFNPNDLDAVTNQVHRFLPDVEVIASAAYNWNEDPFSQGAFPGFRVGELVKYHKELQRSDGNIFFAGSMTAGAWYQFIDGAVESGLRAAREAIQKIG